MADIQTFTFPDGRVVTVIPGDKPEDKPVVKLDGKKLTDKQVDELGAEALAAGIIP